MGLSFTPASSTVRVSKNATPSAEAIDDRASKKDLDLGRLRKITGVAIGDRDRSTFETHR